MPTELDDLDHDTTMVAKLAWGDVPAGVVGDAIEGLATARNRLDAALLAAVRSFEARGEHRAERYTTVTPWLQHHLHLPKRHARRVARLCRFVEGFAAFEAALAAGEISLDHLDVLATAHTTRNHDAWVEAEALLVDSARLDRFEDYARHVRSFADQLDPTDADERFNRQLEDRALTKATSIWGHGHLEAWMDPFSYAIVSDEIDRLERELFQEDWARAKDRLGHDPTTIDLARTPTQRRHDAMVRMAERSSAYAGGTVAASYSVTVHTDTATLEAALARHLGLDDTHLRPEPGTGLCELADGTPLAPAAALFATLAGQVRRIVFDDDDEIINYGRSRRFATTAQGDAVRAKYRRCTHPGGCDHIHTHIDHVVEWQDGGRTDIINLQPLDEAHNRRKTATRHQPSPHHRPDTGQRRLPLRKIRRC